MALLAPLKSGTGVARDMEELSAGNSGWSFLASRLETIDLRNMWRTLWRWRSVVLWTTIAITVIGTVVVYRLTPQYTASTQVMVGVHQVKIANIEDILSELKGDEVTEMVATEIGLIRSRNLAEKTIAKLDLYNSPEFNPSLQQPGMLSRLFHSQTAAAQAWIGSL